MIKLLEKDMRTYRKDTFITSFFATITILLIVLIICSVPSHAASIDSSTTGNGGGSSSYSDDSDNLTSITDFYNIDLNNTSPSGLLNFADNSYVENIGNTNYKNCNNYYYFPDNSSNIYNTAVNSISLENVPKVFTFNDVQYNLSDFSHFCYCSTSAVSGGEFKPFLFISNDDFQYYLEGRYLAAYNLCSHGNCFSFSWLNGHWFIRQGFSTSYDYGTTLDYSDTSNFCGSSVCNLIYSNSSVKGMLYVPNSAGTNRVLSSADGFEYNYLNGQAGNGGTPEDIETPDNNLVMNNGDWTFKNDHYSAPYDSSFPTGSIYPNGSISFSFNPTEYQIANPTAFELVFTFYFKYDVNYKNWNQKFSVFEQTSQLLNNSKRYSHTYNYNDGGAVEIVVPLSDFINNGNNKSWTWQDVFDKLEDGAFTSVLNNSRELYSVSYNKFDLTANAYIKSASDKSGNITEWYNPMSKKGYTTDDSGNLNKNPYVPSASDDPDTSNTQNPEGNAPGEGGNNNNDSSTTSSGGNVTVYNYNTNNNNNSLNSDSNTFNDIFNTMIGSNKVTSESLADTTGTNGFLSFMNNTLTGVPTLFFTNLLNFFITCLAILIVAFVLRMLLDIL